MFRIEDFKAKLNQYGGVARPNLFAVNFSAGPSGLAFPDLKFFCQSVTFPGVDLNVFDYKPNNIDLPQSIPYGIDHQQLECVFIVDDSFETVNYMHEWANRVVEYQSGTDLTTQYQIDYKENYKQNMTITMYSKTINSLQPTPTTSDQIYPIRTYQCVLYDVFPVQVSGVRLGWEMNNEYTTISVAFSYSSFEYKTRDVNV
jgi:hypothetical protein